VDIVALCDVRESRMAAARRWAPQAAAVRDFRRILDSKDVDAVLIATQDQWHAQMLILACNAGKDVYLEKPVMYRLREAKAMIDAVRRNGRIVQIGTQHRAADHIAEAARIVQGGKIGEVRFVRVWNYMSRTGSAPVPDSEPPADLDWDAWLGPAPKVPFNSGRLDYRSWMDYTNGIISDYGNHRFDTVHQIMGAEIPLKVSSSSMRFDRHRAGDIYDFQQATYEYPNFVVSYEASIFNGHGLGGRTPGQRYYGMRGADDRPHGMAFYGTEAALFVDRIGMELYPEPRGARPGLAHAHERGRAHAAPHQVLRGLRPGQEGPVREHRGRGARNGHLLHRQRGGVDRPQADLGRRDVAVQGRRGSQRVPVPGVPQTLGPGAVQLGRKENVQ
jgi:predicted dehydrogenase